MKRLLLTFLLALSAVAPSAAQHRRASDGAAELAVVRATIVDVRRGRLLPDQTVLIRGGRIAAVGPSRRVRVPRGARTIKARGKYLMPGLIDTHVHPWLGEPYGDLAALGAYLASGVTGVRFMSSTRDGSLQLRLRSQAEAGTILSPRLYVSGTVTHKNREQMGAASLAELVRTLAGQGYDGLKILYLDREEALAVIEEARRLRVPVYGHTYTSAGGTRATEDYTLDAVRAGISGLVHVEGIAPERASARRPDTSSTPEPGHYQWRWFDADDAQMQSLIDSMIAHGTWLEPTFAITHFFPQPGRYRDHPDRRFLPVPWEEYRTWFGNDTGETLRKHDEAFRIMQQFARRFHEAGGKLIAGTDNSPFLYFGMHAELKFFVEAGLPPAAALQAATINAAQALGLGDETGTVEAGRVADLVLLDGNPLEAIENTRKISAVIANGRYLDKNALGLLLSRVEQKFDK